MFYRKILFSIDNCFIDGRSYDLVPKNDSLYDLWCHRTWRHHKFRHSKWKSWMTHPWSILLGTRVWWLFNKLLRSYRPLFQAQYCLKKAQISKNPQNPESSAESKSISTVMFRDFAWRRLERKNFPYLSTLSRKIRNGFELRIQALI